MMMKRTLIALAAATAFVPSIASAQAAAASPLTGNFSLTTDYRFRGISQSYALPAVQGGIDWAHASGFYLGNWNSSISGNGPAAGVGTVRGAVGLQRGPITVVMPN